VIKVQGYRMRSVTAVDAATLQLESVGAPKIV
jgi:hypothetical protein